MKKWEYLKQEYCTIEDLNKLGLEGWELISIMKPYRLLVGDNTTAINSKLLYFFKREILN